MAESVEQYRLNTYMYIEIMNVVKKRERKKKERKCSYINTAGRHCTGIDIYIYIHIHTHTHARAHTHTTRTHTHTHKCAHANTLLTIQKNTRPHCSQITFQRGKKKCWREKERATGVILVPPLELQEMVHLCFIFSVKRDIMIKNDCVPLEAYFVSITPQ